MGKRKEARTEEGIMGGHLAALTPCPLPPIAGWNWVMWCDPPATCSMSGTTGHRTGWRRTAGADAGKFFGPEAGPQELPEAKQTRRKIDDEDGAPPVSRPVSRTRRKT